MTEAYLETARKLVPMIRAAADDIDAARELPRPPPAPPIDPTTHPPETPTSLERAP